MNTDRTRILLLHGWFSTGDTKTAFLRCLGYDVLTPRLSNWSFWWAVRAAQRAFNHFRPAIVVGSSRGGAVALNIDRGKTPLVLLSPAWRRFGRVDRVRGPTCIIHSPHDDMIPFSDSIRLCQQSPSAVLLAAGQDHTLNCAEGRRALAWALWRLLPRH